jgi:hypothetical protein
MEDVVSPNFDQPGGGRQYFIMADIDAVFIPRIFP